MPGMKKKCSRDGCERDARARGLCNSHYTVWARKMKGKLALPPDSWKLIRRKLPGSYMQLAQLTGLHYYTVAAIIAEKHESGVVRIADHLPPEPKPGGRWVPVYDLGAEPDHVVSDDTKSQFMRARRREKHQLNKGKLPRKALPMDFFRPAAAICSI